MSMVARVFIGPGEADIYPTDETLDRLHRTYLVLDDFAILGIRRDVSDVTAPYAELYYAGDMREFEDALDTASAKPIIATLPWFQDIWADNWGIGVASGKRFVAFRSVGMGEPDGWASVITLTRSVWDGSYSATVRDYFLGAGVGVQAAVAKPGEPFQLMETFVTGPPSYFLRRRLSRLDGAGRTVLIDDINKTATPVVDGYVYAESNRTFVHKDLDRTDPTSYSVDFSSQATLSYQGPSGIAVGIFKISGQTAYYLALHIGSVITGRLKGAGRRFKTSRTPNW